jgi:hypothetical protein
VRRRRTPALALAAGILLLAVSGCADYAQRRAADLADIGRLNVGAGYGAGVDACVTRYARLSAGGWENIYKVGFVGRTGGLWKERHQGIAVVAGYTETVCEPISGNAFYAPPDTYAGLQPWYRDRERGATEIAVSLCFLVCIEAGVDPGQILDFAVGLVGIDLYKDDARLDARRPPAYHDDFPPPTPDDAAPYSDSPPLPRRPPSETGRSNAERSNP